MGTPAVDYPAGNDRVVNRLDTRARERMRTCGHWLVGVARIGAACIAALSLLIVLVQNAGADVSISATAPPGANGLQDLLNWTAYAGAMACAGSCLYGCAKMALSHQSQSYQGANHGKAIILLSLAGALGLGLTPTLVNYLARGPLMLASLGTSRPFVSVLHLSAILGISLNPLTIAKDIANVFFSSLASLFAAGASALFGALLGFVEQTSDPVFRELVVGLGEAVFAKVLAVSAVVLALSFMVSILTAVISADQAMLARAVRRLPLAVIETGLLIAVVAALVSASDEISSFVANGSSTALSSFAAGALVLAVTGGGIVGIVIAGLLVLACLCVWAELLCRTALIYVAVMAGPLIFAASVHPSAQGLKRRYLEVGFALIFSKVLIALAFATGSALLSGLSSDTSFAGAIGALMEALTILLVACFSPFLLLRLLLGAEAIVVAEGLERRPARALLQANASVSSSGLSNMLRGLSSAAHHGEAGSGGTMPSGPSGPIAPGGPRSPSGPSGSGGASERRGSGGRVEPSTPHPQAGGTRATTPSAPLSNAPARSSAPKGEER